jgi:hypothetical protein
MLYFLRIAWSIIYGWIILKICYLIYQFTDGNQKQNDLLIKQMNRLKL